MTATGAILRREPGRLADRDFDLLVVGAGIHGACVARDAAMRGLSVALIDKGDFGGATSHNSLKLIHGGIRYLQHFDLPRVRQSIRERRFWLTCAPHLVRPLRFVIPAYGYGLRGVAALGAAIHMYGLLGLGCNRGVPESHRVHGGSVLSPREILRLIPDLDAERLTGGVSWTDGQMLDADRVLLACVQSAADAGAVVCNYVGATDFVCDRGRVTGVVAQDQVDGGAIDIRARHCVNAAGPWVNSVVQTQIPEAGSSRLVGLSKCMNLVTRRVVEHESTDCAFGVVSNRSSDAVVDTGGRMFFVTPWRDLSIIGTSHLPYDGHPDDLQCTASDVDGFLEEINAAYPFRLSRSDVMYYHVGLTPAETGFNRGQVRRARHGEIIDHLPVNNVDGLTSVIGVKYTTARLVAEQTVDLVLRKLGQMIRPCATATTPLPVVGQDIDVPQDHSSAVSAAGRPEAALRARSVYAARNEMAVRLGDVIFRRSDLAEIGSASRSAVTLCAESMGAELGWSDQRRRAEIEDVMMRLPPSSWRQDNEHVADLDDRMHDDPVGPPVTMQKGAV